MDYFNHRVTEVELYFKFLENLDKKEPSLHYQDLEKLEDDTIQEISLVMPVSAELIKILKANAYLILYNLIEASFKEALWEILEKVQENNLDYTSISENIQKIWHTEKAWNYRDYTPNQFDYLIKNTAYLVLQDNIKFNRDFINKKQLSGNIDMTTIIELSSLYGFGLPRIQGEKKSNFDTVKTQRNNLAHGNLTFTECGKEYSITELIKLKNVIISFMQEVLQNISQFIEDKKYKK
jgi:hypothetical protein